MDMRIVRRLGWMAVLVAGVGVLALAVLMSDAMDTSAREPKVESLTVVYHDFGLGSPVTVELVEKKKNNAELVGLVGGTVAAGDSFTVQKKAAAKGLNPRVELELNGSAVIKIHTSCSKPIDLGFVYADDDDDAHEADSIGEFNPAGFTSALEITALLPVGVCGSAAPTPTPTPTPPPTPPPECGEDPPQDTDGDCFKDFIELILGSDPFDPDSTPEHSSLPETCQDGLDNDKDNFTDGDDPGCQEADTDGDTIPDSSDNCMFTPNPNQEDMDGDDIGDACDSDIDGDGYSNDWEVIVGTEPLDPNSHP